jgi:lipid A 4'-phosphatase
MTDPRGRAPSDAALEEAQRLDRYLWAGLLFSAAIFAKFPALDLLVSSRYHHPERGFVLGEAAWVQALHAWTPRVGLTLVALLLLFLTLSPLLAWVLRHRAGWRDHLMGFGRRTAILALLVAACGPGLLSEGLTKHTVGRPRPVQTDVFGGAAPFQGPFQIGDNPAVHRSFVSSTAAAGYALLGLGLACGPLWRRRWLLIGLATGSVVGLGRILQGGHYLSDVVFSFYAVWLASLAIRWAADSWFPPRSAA